MNYCFLESCRGGRGPPPRLCCARDKRREYWQVPMHAREKREAWQHCSEIVHWQAFLQLSRDVLCGDGGRKKLLGCGSMLHIVGYARLPGCCSTVKGLQMLGMRFCGRPLIVCTCSAKCKSPAQPPEPRLSFLLGRLTASRDSRRGASWGPGSSSRQCC